MKHFDRRQKIVSRFEMEPVYFIPTYGFHRARRQPQSECRRLNLSSRLLQLLDDSDLYYCDSSQPSLYFHTRKRGTKESPGDSDSKPPKQEEKPDRFVVSTKLGDAFSPEELSVKVVGKSLKIEGKHEEKGEDGEFSSQQFTRIYQIPDDVDLEQLTSSFSSEGVLYVEAPRLVKEELKPTERNIPIEQREEAPAIGNERTEEEERSESNEDVETKDLATEKEEVAVEE